MNQADKYAELAMAADRYNPSALVNKGNVLFAKSEYEKALHFYKEAVSIESSCVEALFNMGTFLILYIYMYDRTIRGVQLLLSI